MGRAPRLAVKDKGRVSLSLSLSTVMAGYFFLNLLLFAGGIGIISNANASHELWVVTQYPQDEKKLWWDEAWWAEGTLDRPANYDVVVDQIEYTSGDSEVPAFVFRPAKAGNYLPVLFQHGRRGLDDLTMLLPRRLAARGFVVLAPDVWSATL
jgi:hypothetical protein